MKKIKSIATYSVDEFTSEEGVLIRLEERDKAGHLLAEKQYHPEGGLESRIERTYDAEGRLTSEKEYAGDADEVHQETSYQYTAAGRLEEAVIKYQDGSLTYRKYQHDEADNSETIDIVDEDGEYEGKEFRRYDSEGRILKEVIHDEDKNLEQDITRIFDEHGYVMQRITLLPDDMKIHEEITYERDEKGLITLREIVDETEELMRFDEFEYDEKGNTTLRRAQDYNQGWAIVDEFEFDEKDRIIKSKRSKPNGTIVQETDYTFNEAGQLIEEQNRTSSGVALLLYKYDFFEDGE